MFFWISGSAVFLAYPADRGVAPRRLLLASLLFAGLRLSKNAKPLSNQPLSLPFCGCKSTTFPQTHKHFFQLFYIINRYLLIYSVINLWFFSERWQKGVLVVLDNRISAFEMDGNDAKSGIQVHEMGGNAGFSREIFQRMRVKLNKKNGCGYATSILYNKV